MTTSMITESGTIPAIGHREAMTLAEEEARRLLDVVDRLSDQDWSRPTDCEGWDVKALLSHVLGAMEANARSREFIRQFRAAAKAANSSGRPMIDEMTANQVREHADLTPTEIAGRLHATAANAVRGRRRMPAVMRAMPFKPGAPFEGKWKLGYLVDIIMNRDYWMHRVDLTRATGNELELSETHDGRVVADVVAEWARAHGKPFTLTLEGLAGGTFVQGEQGETLRLDAVEFCRILSGRGSGTGLLTQQVPF
jgi:uncharacterized protein (TIGR03083 family)